MPRLVLYPVLAAAYPVLALASANPSEIPGLWVLTWPLVISVFVCLTAWLALSFVVRDRDRRAFLTLMVVVLFASHGYIRFALDEVAWAAPYARTVLPFLFIASYLLATTFLVFRRVPDLRKVTRFLTVLTAVLVLWNTVGLLRSAALWTEFSLQPRVPLETDTSETTQTSGAPDIYLIVLDKYTGSQSLRDNFGFDNTDFEKFLIERDFVLPRTAQANYIYTMLSLASLLNYRYLDEFPTELDAQTRNKVSINHLVEDNAALRFLQARRYRFVFFPTALSFTASNRFADQQIPAPRKIRSEFEIVWRRTSLAEPVLSWVCQRLNCARAVTPLTGDSELLDWKFDQLRQLPRRQRDGRPLFVFAHLMIPHEPYVFNADCSMHPPFWPSFSVVLNETPEKEAYVAQISCLNRRLKGVVEHLLRDSPSPPIILLQSDHGHGRMPLHIPEVNAVTVDRRAERAHVFAAYYLPGANGGIIYDSITPVNVFRSIFRHYFGADLEPLPDKTYWSPGTNLFKFTRLDRGLLWQE